MDEKALRLYAAEYGYSRELCLFLDKLESNLELLGLGKYYVADAMFYHLPEYDVVKIALANTGRIFSEFLPGSTEKSRNNYTFEDWINEGEKEFRKHCDRDGKFRYSDFNYEETEEITPPDDLAFTQK